MNITLIGVIGVVLFAILGYSRGMYRILAAFVSFVLAALLAKPASSLILGLVAKSGFVPKALVPLAGQLLAGIFLFLVFLYCAGRILRRREEGRERLRKTRMALGERIGGFILGTAWGLFLVVFILTGIHLIGNVEEVLVQPLQPIEEKPFSTTVETEEAMLPEGKFVELKKQIEGSPFGDIVKKVDPVDEKIKETFHNLKIVVSDPDLYQDFTNHPVIARFTKDPKMLALFEDEQIQRQLQAGEYYALLDNAKIASLLKDKALYQELKNVDLGEILKEVIEKNPTTSPVL